MIRRILLVLVSISLASSLSAQNGTGTLTGRVTTEGRPLAGVHVTASSESSGTRSTLTTRSGRYELASLPPGEYELSFSAPGVQHLTRRVNLELEQTARADAELAPSVEGESVTVTSTPPVELETPTLRTTIAFDTADALPLGRSLADIAALATPLPGAPVVLVDGSPAADASLVVSEAVEETSVLRASIPAVYAAFEGPVVSAATRAPGASWSGSVRDTLQEGDHTAEAILGGPAIADRLWLFGAARRADDVRLGDASQLKATAQPFEGHNLAAAYLDAGSEASEPLRHLRYDALLAPNLTVDAVVGRLGARSFARATAHYLAASGSGGAHALKAGLDDDIAPGVRGFFAEDRWTISSRWSAGAGLRHESREGRSDTMPRLFAIYDPVGDGRRRIAATFGRYACGDGACTVEEAAFTYALLLGSEGFFRTTVMRRGWDDPSGTIEHATQLEGGYALFDIVVVGGNYTWSEGGRSASGREGNRHTLNAWVQVAPPVAFGDVSIAILHRHRTAELRSTDLGFRFGIPIGERVGVTLMADVLNFFEQELGPAEEQRWRFGARLRF